MAGGEHVADDLLERVVGIDHVEVAAVDHDLFHGQLAQFEDAQHLVARALGHSAFLVVQVHRAADFLCR